jgi:hypothetical protein
MQDINTVNADLQRPMQNFEDFPDHITEHVNHYDSLASFMQPCANIAKIKTLTRSSPLGKNRTQTSSPATSKTSPITFSPDSTIWIKTSIPEAATHTQLAKAAKENNPKEKAASGDAAKVKERAKTTAKAVHSQTTTNLSNHSSHYAYTNAKHRQ